jgi:hypothetical protein
MKTKYSSFGAALFLVVTSASFMHAQDTIQKVNGEFILGKVLEVGTSTVSYKKKGFEDGPTYSEELKTVANIRYKGVRRDDYKKAKLVSSTTYGIATATADAGKTPVPVDEKLPPMLSGSSTGPENGSQGGNNGSSKTGSNNGTNTSGPTNPQNTNTQNNTTLANGPVSNQYRIEHLDKKFMVNGQKVSSKAVDKLLAGSSNPAVVTMAKSAKLMKNFQKAMKIVSIPSTISGGIASVSTFSRMYNQIQENGASFNSCKDFGLSFLGTLTGPITSKLMKKKRDKLYDKAIDLYNFRN